MVELGLMSQQHEDMRPLSQYDVFISYSWGDGRLAGSIQRGLQRIARPWYKRAVIRVVRDATTMSTSPDLRQTVLDHLDDSRNLLVIGSPSGARSPWVNREIAHWLETSRSGLILPVLAAGEWRYPPDGDSDDDDDPDAAAPPALRGAADEPRYLDLRWAQDDQHLSLRNKRFRDAIGELAAGVLNTSKDRIVGEEIRVRRRNTRWVVAAAIVLALALVSHDRHLCHVGHRQRDRPIRTGWRPRPSSSALSTATPPHCSRRRPSPSGPLRRRCPRAFRCSSNVDPCAVTSTTSPGSIRSCSQLEELR